MLLVRNKEFTCVASFEDSIALDGLQIASVSFNTWILFIHKYISDPLQKIWRFLLWPLSCGGWSWVIISLQEQSGNFPARYTYAQLLLQE